MYLHFLSALIFFMGCHWPLAFAADNWAKPLLADEETSALIYNFPGFNADNCSEYEGCAPVAEIEADSAVIVQSAITISHPELGPVKYYKVEYATAEGMKSGYIEEGYLDVKKEPEECSSQAFAFTADMGENLIAEMRDSVLKSSIPTGNRKLFAPNCEKIIDKDGNLGAWGEKAMRALELADKSYKAANAGQSCFMDVMDFKSLCPKFKNFTPEIKKKFYAYTFASMASKESSCKPGVRVPGRYDVAVGLFQMEQSASRRKLIRDPILCKTKDPTDITFQFNCSASILRDTHCKAGGNKSIYSNGSYWQQLSPKRVQNELARHVSAWRKMNAKRIISGKKSRPYVPPTKIPDLISKFPGCK